MTPSLAVFVPVLNRPHRVAPLAESYLATTHGKGRGLYFICSPGDDDEIAAVREQGVEPLIVDWLSGRADYAKKMNHAWRTTDEDWVLFGADDIVFHPGWFDACLSVHADTSACVIGTNDLGNVRVLSGIHSTHPLVSRAYGACGTIDDETVVLHEGYWHNYVDDEFVQTALFRETYAHAHLARLEHLHPSWQKGEWDDTYSKGRERFEDDAVYYRQRQRLWGGVR